MATRHQLPVRIVTVYSGAINLRSTMLLEQPDQIAAPMYRIIIEAFGLTFVSLVMADAAPAFELRMVAQLRELMGRARVIARFLQLSNSEVEAMISESMLAGVEPDSTLDQLVLASR